MGPIEKGIIYIVLPFIQPVNLSLTALSILEGDIQLPRVPLTPSLGVGIVSDSFSVLMKVFDSTRAVSAGFVLANQLEEEKKLDQIYLQKCSNLCLTSSDISAMVRSFLVAA